MITLLVFTVKANFFDRPVDNPQTEISESIETSEGENSENVPANSEPPQFHISLIDVGVLLVVVTAYCIHTLRRTNSSGALTRRTKRSSHLLPKSLRSSPTFLNSVFFFLLCPPQSPTL